MLRVDLARVHLGSEAMARKPSKFVNDLSSSDIEQLEVASSVGATPRIRQRAQAILWSHSGRSVSEIADLLQLQNRTISAWIDRWLESGIDGLADAARSGAPPILTPAESEQALAWLDETPHQPKSVLLKIQESFGKTISADTLSRIARLSRRRWKRMRRSLKFRRDEEEFRLAERELQELKDWHWSGEIDLFFGDQTGFSLVPTVPYAWQKIGQQGLLPSARSSRQNVFGLFSCDQRLWTYQFEGSINTELIIDCIDDFSKHLRRPTVLVLDNASIHHGDEFDEQIETWERRGLVMYYLPPYSPELNLIETLWRVIKYHWLPLTAYRDKTALRETLDSVFLRIGKSLRLTI